MPSSITYHEVPTHLNVEDKVVFGLTVRQFLYLLVGSSASYGLWDQAAALGDVVRSAAVATSALTTLALALVRPADRALEEWLAAALVYFRHRDFRALRCKKLRHRFADVPSRAGNERDLTFQFHNGFPFESLNHADPSHSNNAR